MGLINEVVPLENFEGRIVEICEQIMKNSAAAIKEAKYLVELRHIYKFPRVCL